MNRRAASRIKVDVLINRFLGGRPHMCRMTDISPTGLRLVPILQPHSGHRYVGLQFQLPGGSGVLTASGEVVNGSDDSRGFGVRFTNVPPESASAIRAFVDSVAASFADRESVA